MKTFPNRDPLTACEIEFVLETERLLVRRLELEDAAFIYELVNEPSWLRYIGDKNVQNITDAQRYIRNGPVEMYDRLGFGLFRVELKKSGDPIGICGFLKRDALEDVDLGFALLPRFWGKGYAFESASAVMSYGETGLGLSRIIAIISCHNLPSARLVEKLGFRFEHMVRLKPGGEELKQYGTFLRRES